MSIFKRDKRHVPTAQEVHDCIDAIVYDGVDRQDFEAMHRANLYALKMTGDYALVRDVEGPQEAYERLCYIRDHPFRLPGLGKS